MHSDSCLLLKCANKKTPTLFLFLLFILISACSQKESPSKALQNSISVDIEAIQHNARNMDVKYQVVSNIDDLDCYASLETSDCYSSTLSLRFSAQLPASGWYIVFSHLSPVQRVNSSTFTIERINGDVHKISPKQQIDADTLYEIGLISQFWSVSKSDILPNYFFVFNEQETAVIEATKEVMPRPNRINASHLPIIPHAGSYDSEHQIKRNAQDNTQGVDAAAIYQRNSEIHNGASIIKGRAAERIIPQIKNVSLSGGEVDLSKGLNITLPSSISQANDMQVIDNLLADFSIAQSVNGVPLEVTLEEAQSKLSHDAYSMTITDDKIQIQAQSKAGINYAFVSLVQLISKQNTLALGKYVDAPNYAFRGLHLDVARNFRNVDFIKKLIRQMHFLKLNKLHLHLADDEGWRLAIDGLDELTSIGAYRCFDPNEQQCLLPQLGSGPDRDTHVNGYYSNEQYMEILKFAQQHNVEVIPSLDMPGHSRAAIKAMEARYHRLIDEEKPTEATEFLLSDFADTTQYSSVQHYNDNTINPCLPSTYRFVEKVLTHLIGLHQQADVALTRYHIGADETAGAWFESPVCQALIEKEAPLTTTDDLASYFIGRVAALVEEYGVIAAGWSDGMSKVDTSKRQAMQVNVWDVLMWGGHQSAYDFTAKNWRTVLSFPDVLYFDFPYAASPDEHGYYWASRATDSFKVFQFNSHYIAQNARLWKDRMGNDMAFDSKDYPSIETTGVMEGIQAHLWSEVVRHDELAEYMLYPRLASVAERAWSKADWQTTAPNLSKENLNAEINADWQSFSKALISKVLPYLTSQQVNYRVPPPGAYFDGKAWQMNHIYAGMQIQYSEEQTQWLMFDAANPPKSANYIRAKVPQIERFSRSLPLPEIAQAVAR